MMSLTTLNASPPGGVGKRLYFPIANLDIFGWKDCVLI